MVVSRMPEEIKKRKPVKGKQSNKWWKLKKRKTDA